MGTAIDIRAVRDDDEFARWFAIASIPFGLHADPDTLAIERPLMVLDRTVAAVSGDEIVGTAGSYAFDLTVPGGATLATSGVTAVGVLATHRRRGVLRQMMHHQLDDVVARGEALAVLNASESAIYGRFGYGLAQRFHSYRIDTRHAAFRSDAMRLVDQRPSLRYVLQADAAPVVAPIFDAYAAARPGEVTRRADWWSAVLGPTEEWKGGGKLFVVVADADGRAGDPGGYVIFTTAFTGPGGRMKLTVRELVASTPATEAALWRLVLDVDLVDEVEAEGVPTDCPLRHWLVDPRQARVWRDHDYLWVRLLDVPRALAARRYGAPGTLVVDVADRFRPACAGRYRLHVAAGRDGAGECVRVAETDADADLGLDIEDLGALYLGAVRADHLVRAGRVTEHVPGAAARATSMFLWPVAPMCLTRF